MTERRQWKPAAGWWFTCVFAAAFLWGIFEAREWSEKTSLFPLMVSIPMFLLCIFQMTREILRQLSPSTGRSVASSTDAMEETIYNAHRRKVGMIVAQMLAYFAGIFLLGFFEVIPLFTILYLRFSAREPWWRAVAQAVAIFVFCWVLFKEVLHLPFSDGVLVALIRPLLPA